MGHAFRLGDQRGWYHDEGHAVGVFHTFDRFSPRPDLAPRKVHVYLPRDVGARRLPVLYVHDGHTAFWRGGEAHQTWDMATVLDREARRIGPVLIVAIHPLDRNREYTHADWMHGQRTWGGLPAHAEALATAFKPWVDAHYPTDPRPQATAVLGSSHGGLAAFWAATRHPDAFGMAACLSPSFFTGLDSLVHGATDASLERSELVQGALATLSDPARRPRLWLDWGLRRDGGDHNRVVEHLAALRGAQMADLLQRRFGYRRQNRALGEPIDGRANLTVTVDATAGHEEPAWSRRFAELMPLFFPRSP